MKEPRIVTWRAVSTEDQAEKESLDYQDRLNREHAARWSGVIISELEVPGRSRSIVLWEDACRAIPAYAELDDLIRRKAFDILMCLDATRLGRDRALITTLAALCERAGIRIYETSSPPTNLDGPHSTADSRLLMMLKGHISEEEVRKFSERSVFGRKARIKKGKHPGPPIYGYERAFDANGIAHLAINEEQAEVVRLFYDLFLNHGRSLQSICDEFNARGIYSPRSKSLWVPGTIRLFIDNGWAYAGYTSWGTRYSSGKIKESERFRARAEWEPIISEDEARRATVIRESRMRARRAVSSPYRLSMVAACGYCGSTITVHAYPGGPGSTVATNRYLCVKHCRGSRIGEPDMIIAIEEYISALQDQGFFESLIDDTPDQYAVLEKRRDDATKSLHAVREQRRRLTLAFTRDTINLDEYESLMAELEVRHSDLARTVATLEDSLAATPTADKRRQRVTAVRDHGLAMLHHEDLRTANNWLREHLQLIIANYQVNIIKIL